MVNPPLLPPLDIRRFYDRFDAPVTDFDCGQKCAPHNPSGKPFCCDICHAVPVAFRQEWDYLQPRTDLWHAWRGDECSGEPIDPQTLEAETPEHLTLLACKGPAHCQREYRASSCRQFPFFPYITASDRFIGLAYEWEFEEKCWVISNLWSVTQRYRDEFIRTYDDLFALWPEEYESYYATSEEMREHFAKQRRRIPILHRDGGFYLLSPGSGRLTRADSQRYRRFGVYKEDNHRGIMPARVQRTQSDGGKEEQEEPEKINPLALFSKSLCFFSSPCPLYPCGHNAFVVFLMR